MSPAPAHTSRSAIIAAGRALLEEGGLDAVTMATVAAEVGVKPPSLYKHIRDRSALLAAMATDGAEELGRVLAQAGARAGDTPTERLVALADAYGDFARRSPRTAAMLFAGLGPELQAPLEAAALSARPIIEVAAELVGADGVLAAARVLTAFAYGFTSMETAGAFRFGGDVDEAFRWGVAALARGLAAGETETGRPD
jgi:AcrR family transcriptional regulator